MTPLSSSTMIHAIAPGISSNHGQVSATHAVHTAVNAMTTQATAPSVPIHHTRALSVIMLPVNANQMSLFRPRQATVH